MSGWHLHSPPSLSVAYYHLTIPQAETPALFFSLLSLLHLTPLHSSSSPPAPLKTKRFFHSRAPEVRLIFTGDESDFQIIGSWLKGTLTTSLIKPGETSRRGCHVYRMSANLCTSLSGCFTVSVVTITVWTKKAHVHILCSPEAEMCCLLWSTTHHSDI